MPKVSLQPRPITCRLWMSTKVATEAAEKKVALDAAAKNKKAETKAVGRLLALARPEAKNISGNVIFAHIVALPPPYVC